MAINKVEFGGNTLIDITDTTATPGSVENGKVFYQADGTRGKGTLTMGNAKNYYGTCSTKNSTQAKVVDCTGFVLETGATIDIKFTNAQTYNGAPTLNINSTGAITITGGLKGIWNAGDVMRFVYDGTSYRMVSNTFGGTNYYGVVKMSTDLTSTATNLAATISTVHQAYNLADTANTLADSAYNLANSKQDPPTVLYTNTNGSTVSITTLSDSVSNYSYLEIFYGWSGGSFGLTSCRFDMALASSYNINLSTIVYNNNKVYWATSKWTPTGTKLNLAGGEYWSLGTSGSGSRGTTNNIAIYKVLGYK